MTCGSQNFEERDGGASFDEQLLKVLINGLHLTTKAGIMYEG